MGILVESNKIKNIVILGHTGSGKTMLLESILFVTKALKEKGSIEKGTTVSDFDEEEKSRKISLRSSIASTKFNDFKLNFIDAPGSSEFIGEVKSGLRASDNAIIVIDGESGIQIETVKHWKLADEFNLPRIVFINKMDKENVKYNAIIDNLKETFNKPVVPLEIPIYENKKFIGIIEIVDKKAYKREGDTWKEILIPDSYKDEVTKTYDLVMEAVSEGKDEYIEKFLSGQALTHEEMLDGLLLSTKMNKFIPVICGSVAENIGIQSVLNISTESFISFTELKETTAIKDGKEIKVKTDAFSHFSGFCFKTLIDQFSGKLSFVKVITGEIKKDDEIIISGKNSKIKVNKILQPIGNKFEELEKGVCGDIIILQKIDDIVTSTTVAAKDIMYTFPSLKLPQAIYSVAIHTNDKNIEDKLIGSLQKFTDEDMTLQIHFNPETKQNVVSGMGELHLEVYFSKIRKALKSDFIIEIPRVNYKETITKPVESRYKHKKQSGGHGQYGEVALKISPNKRGEGFKFLNSIVGGSIPKQYIPGVEKGLLEGLTEGVLGKFPVVDIVADVYDGSYHDVDSSEMSFKIASRQALKEGFEKADPIILEPIMKLSVYCQNKYTGDIISDLNGKRGKINGMDPVSEGITILKAEAPHSELLRYATDLKSKTQGTASFELEFSHYSPLTGKNLEIVLDERKRHLASIEKE